MEQMDGSLDVIKYFYLRALSKKALKYWKHLSYDVLAMVEQLGISTYFLTLYNWWEELPCIKQKIKYYLKSYLIIFWKK